MSPPTISVYNKASTPLPLPLEELVKALQAFVDQHLGPAWGVACKLQVTDGPTPGSWGLVFLDTADVDGALAYHTDDGQPLSKVFVKTTLQAGESLSVSASHELAEMLVDPGCNTFSMDENGKLYCMEVADAVEGSSFEVNGLPMSNFVYPAWFGLPGASQYDHLNTLGKPYALADHGYATTCMSNATSQTFGSEEKAARYATEDRRGRRGMLRRSRAAGDSPDIL